MPKDEARSTKKLPAVKPAYVMKMNADEARSERERQHCHYHAEYFEACANCADAEKLWRSGWDAAIDAAAKCIREFDNDGDVVSRASQVAAILALKGDRNEQSGTE